MVIVSLLTSVLIDLGVNKKEVSRMAVCSLILKFI